MLVLESEYEAGDEFTIKVVPYSFAYVGDIDFTVGVYSS